MKRKLLMFTTTVLASMLFMMTTSAATYKTYNIGEEVKYNPIIGDFCNDDESNNCYTFNVINNSEQQTIEIMMNKNIVSSVRPNETAQELATATQDWDGVELYNDGSNSRIISLDEAKNLIQDTIQYNNTNNTYYSAANNNRWLINDVDGNYKYGYWTSTPGDNNFYWNVTNSGGYIYLEQNKYDSSYPTGIRPIIKVRRTVLSRSIIFDAGEGTGNMDTIDLEELEFEVPECTFTAPAGKVFAYWLIGDEKLYPGDSYDTLEDVTLVAVYKNDSVKTTSTNNSASNVKNTVKNPKTGDSLYTIIGLITLAGVAVAVSYKKVLQK